MYILIQENNLEVLSEIKKLKNCIKKLSEFFMELLFVGDATACPYHTSRRRQNHVYGTIAIYQISRFINYEWE